MDIARPQYDDPLFAWQPPCKPSATPVPAVCSAPAEEQPERRDLPAEFVQIWAVLERHRGAANAITAPQIADAAGLWAEMAPANRGTKVRKVLELTQDVWPWPVCASQDGYFLAMTGEELTQYSLTLRNRAVYDFRRRKTVRRIAVQVGFPYLGQGRFGDRRKGEGVVPIARAHE